MGILKKAHIYTDGACSGNPGPGGYGVIVESDGKYVELSGNENPTTNNRMELTAVIKGLETLKEPYDIVLCTDSKYVADSIQQGWVYKWRDNGWVKSSKGKVVNIDLWKRLLELLDFHNVKFEWVKGHAGHPKNERCDTLATGAINGRGEWRNGSSNS